MNLGTAKIAVIGLGYVGLPLVVEFGKKYEAVGFDLNKSRIQELLEGTDSTLELTGEELRGSNKVTYTNDLSDIKSCNVYIVTVPTPIDKHKQPDLTPLLKASEMLGKVINKGDVVIYESTVYPGATEDECIPVIEQVSGYIYNKDFFAGYSPERINPGDKKHRVTNILKVTSGSNPLVSEYVDELYRSIITAGTHKAATIKVAEASKVIENVQRDVNIALINELHQIFVRLGINTNDVIEAASTKWNFMKLKPGLVGGHCIGVDPYYLLHKSTEAGYIPDLMRTAREINDSMPHYIATNFISELIKKKVSLVDAHVLIMGFTFKENCPDIRNTKVFDLYQNLVGMGIKVSVYDKCASKADVEKEYGLELVDSINNEYTAAILAVNHTSCLELKNQLEINGLFVYSIKE